MRVSQLVVALVACVVTDAKMQPSSRKALAPTPTATARGAVSTRGGGAVGTMSETAATARSQRLSCFPRSRRAGDAGFDGYS